MNLEQMKERKRELGYTYEQIAELSGVPLGTVQKVFSGATASPRYDTLRALEQVFQKKEELFVREAVVYGTKKQGEYTVEDYRALPDDQRMELIDGVLYDMAAPTGIHQIVGGEIYAVLREHIRKKRGKCLPMYSPIDVQLDCDDKTIVQPDVLVLCDTGRLSGNTITGAPDFIVEVLSKSTKKKDMFIKLNKYLHIKGETLGHVHFGINYLNNPDSYSLGERVIVIGAGNAAMDVARTAVRKGARHLTCFSLTKKVAASHHEFSYAALEGVQFEYNKAPVEITDEGVIFKDIIENEDGTFADVPDSETLYPADSVIVSISQGPQNRIVQTTTGLTANERGLLVADETGHTGRPGIFASGDVVNGARTVVEAVAHSKIVAESMHEYLQSLID